MVWGLLSGLRVSLPAIQLANGKQVQKFARILRESILRDSRVNKAPNAAALPVLVCYNVRREEPAVSCTAEFEK